MTNGKRRIVGIGAKRTVPAPQASDAMATPVVAKRDDPPVIREPPDRTNEPKPGETFGSEFLDNIAHQMVAPLQSIKMHCKNVIDGVVPDEDRNKRLREVVGHAQMLIDLAHQMRFLHELVTDKALDADRLEFSTIVTTWIDGFNNYLPIVEQSNLKIDIDHVTMNRLPDVVATRLAAHQVIMNLYDNAMKYGMPSGSVRVRAHVDGEYVVNEFSHRARVRLTSEAAERIFERGYRAPEALRVRASGTGLGMWISKKLMESMRGDLKVTPTSEEGITRFRIFWRIARNKA